MATNQMQNGAPLTQVQHKQEEGEKFTSELLASPPGLRRSPRLAAKKNAGHDPKTPRVKLTLNFNRRTAGKIRLVRQHKIIRLSLRGQPIGRFKLNTEKWTLDEEWKKAARLRWQQRASASQ